MNPLSPSRVLLFASASILTLGLVAAPLQFDSANLIPDLQIAQAKNGGGKGGGNGGGGNGGGNGGGKGRGAESNLADGKDDALPDGLSQGKDGGHTGQGVVRGIGHAKYGDGTRETDKIGRGNGFGHRKADVADVEDVGDDLLILNLDGDRAAEDRLGDGRLSEIFGATGGRASPSIGPRPKPTVFVVYFGFDEADLDAESIAVVGDVEAAVRNASNPKIYVVGNADRAGPATYNIGLAQRRASAVTAALADLDLTAEVITVKGFGEARPFIKTADGVRNPFNRRVEIVVIDDTSLTKKISGLGE